MGLVSSLSKPFAKYIHKQTVSWSSNPVEVQNKVLKQIVGKASKTQFGQDHHFSKIKSHQAFKSQVPINDYEGLRPYIDKMVQGESDILWPGKPLYLSKTSGTTSGVKYIPITKDSIPNHLNSARNALLSYIHSSGNSQFLEGNLMFLSGSPTLETKSGIHVGRLSGIVNHHIPSYLKRNQMPSYDTNCIEDWENKLDAIIEETLNKPMSLISGIPPWVQMYFDRIEAKTQNKIIDVFPDFSLFVYGGVNFEPYKEKLFHSIGKRIDSVETYPASEGFIAYQDRYDQEGLLLILNSGIYYEFIPVDEYYSENPTRLSIGEVELGVNYAVILNSNAGLWGYSIGDTVKFISKVPYRLLVTGRIKHFISAFGEHVIGEEVERAMKLALEEFVTVKITEFTVAPFVSSDKGMSRHEWYIEFDELPIDVGAFERCLDSHLVRLNTYYNDLISGNILSKLKVKYLKKDGFINYMKSQGKLGGQNKVPRLSNDRKIADELDKYLVI